jgi:hypothetical protein
MTLTRTLPPRTLLAFCLSAIAGLAVPAVARAQEVWLAPQASVPPSRLHRAVDFMDMFRPDAPWGATAARVRVFKLYAPFVSAASQEQVNAIVDDLGRRHIAIALEAGPMNIGPASTHPACGGLGLVEGYGVPAQARVIADKIKRAGGVIRYIAMDEPIWFGHYFPGKPGGQPPCHDSVGQIARLVVPTLSAYIEAFPTVTIGDIEPTAIAEQPGWRAVMADWAKAYQATMGRPLAFIHLDVAWARPAAAKTALDMFAFSESLKQQGLVEKVGIIYDASDSDLGDVAWVREAHAHIRFLEMDNGLRPDQVIFQSWMTSPTHALPETAPDTLTGLANAYIQARP